MFFYNQNDVNHMNDSSSGVDFTLSLSHSTYRFLLALVSGAISFFRKLSYEY